MTKEQRKERVLATLTMLTEGRSRNGRACGVVGEEWISEILAGVGSAAGLTITELTGKDRSPGRVTARRMACWVLHNIGLGFRATANACGYDNHTSVMYNVKQIITDVTTGYAPAMELLNNYRLVVEGGQPVTDGGAARIRKRVAAAAGRVVMKEVLADKSTRFGVLGKWCLCYLLKQQGVDRHVVARVAGYKSYHSVYHFAAKFGNLLMNGNYNAVRLLGEYEQIVNGVGAVRDRVPRKRSQETTLNGAVANNAQHWGAMFEATGVVGL
ncbi:hypothetical protein EBZ39_03595 [bacterium]|nr:hypothetical protein [bacterium]